MANRERKNELKIYLSDDEQYILEQKVKASGMKTNFLLSPDMLCMSKLCVA